MPSGLVLSQVTVPLVLTGVDQALQILNPLPAFCLWVLCTFVDGLEPISRFWFLKLRGHVGFCLEVFLGDSASLVSVCSDAVSDWLWVVVALWVLAVSKVSALGVVIVRIDVSDDWILEVELLEDGFAVVECWLLWFLGLFWSFVLNCAFFFAWGCHLAIDIDRVHEGLNAILYFNDAVDVAAEVLCCCSRLNLLQLSILSRVKLGSRIDPRVILAFLLCSWALVPAAGDQVLMVFDGALVLGSDISHRWQLPWVHLWRLLIVPVLVSEQDDKLANEPVSLPFSFV